MLTLHRFHLTPTKTISDSLVKHIIGFEVHTFSAFFHLILIYSIKRFRCVFLVSASSAFNYSFFWLSCVCADSFRLKINHVFQLINTSSSQILFDVLFFPFFHFRFDFLFIIAVCPVSFRLFFCSAFNFRLLFFHTALYRWFLKDSFDFDALKIHFYFFCTDKRFI